MMRRQNMPDDGQDIQAVLDQIHMNMEDTFMRGTDASCVDSLFNVLIGEYHSLLVAHVCYIVKSREVAEEVVQGTWMAFYRRIQKSPTCLKEMLILPWLKDIAKKRAYDTLSKEQISAISLDIDETNHVFELSISPLEHPEQIVIRQTVSRALHNLVEFLPLRQRQVLILYFFKEHSQKEISQELEIPINTVKSHLRRGIQNLRRMLEEQVVTNDDLEFWKAI